MLIILSLYGGSEANFYFVSDYCSLEALDTNMSIVLASVTLPFLLMFIVWLFSLPFDLCS